MIKYTQNQFIEKAMLVHNNFYDYSLVNYTHNDEKIVIVCPYHGEFYQKARKHLEGNKCIKCTREKNKSTTQQFIEKAMLVHNNFYTYEETQYINSESKVLIECPKHGKFSQFPSHHINGSGCNKCAKEKLSTLYRMTQEKFISRAKKKHNNFYDYSKVVYGKNSSDKVIIICPEHGEFMTTPEIHLISECKKCVNKKRSIIYRQEKSSRWNPDREYVKIRKNIANRCYDLLRKCYDVQNSKKIHKTKDILNYDIQDLYNHITNHPNWENVKDKKWHIDHIIPIVAFVKHGITDLKIINALDNLQPLEAKENLSKNDKYNKENFYNYLTRKNVILYSHPCG